MQSRDDSVLQKRPTDEDLARADRQDIGAESYAAQLFRTFRTPEADISLLNRLGSRIH